VSLTPGPARLTPGPSPSFAGRGDVLANVVAGVDVVVDVDEKA